MAPCTGSLVPSRLRLTDTRANFTQRATLPLTNPRSCRDLVRRDSRGAGARSVCRATDAAVRSRESRAKNCRSAPQPSRVAIHARRRFGDLVRNAARCTIHDLGRSPDRFRTRHPASNRIRLHSAAHNGGERHRNDTVFPHLPARSASTIVAVGRIASAVRKASGPVVRLTNGVRLRTSRQYAARIRALLRTDRS